MIEDALNHTLVRINKPLSAYQVEFKKDEIWLNLFYGGKKGTILKLRYKSEKTDTIEDILEFLNKRIAQEFIETNWT